MSVPKVNQESPIDPITPTQQLVKVISSTNWLATIAIIGVGAGVFAFLNGSTKGIQIMAASFVVLSLVLGVARYGFWIATIPMLASVGLFVYTVFVNKKALKQIITNIQKFKEDGSDETMIDELKVWLNKQSTSTKEIVSTIKSKLSGAK